MIYELKRRKKLEDSTAAGSVNLKRATKIYKNAEEGTCSTVHEKTNMVFEMQKKKATGTKTAAGSRKQAWYLNQNLTDILNRYTAKFQDNKQTWDG